MKSKKSGQEAEGPAYEVVVQAETEVSEPQPETFRFCPLGVQFYSRRRLPAYQQIELQVSGAPGIVGAKRPTRCEGVVVHTQYDRRRKQYRHWILFVELPDSLRKQFRCVAQQTGSLCPHCENF